MQKPNEKKRQVIMGTAAKLFATRPYHSVRLEDVASAANVGKGTIYIYFESKDALFFSLLYEGFAALIEDLERELANEREPAREALRRIVGGLVSFTMQYPHLAEMMRSIGGGKGDGKWEKKRAELSRIIETTLRRGVRRGEISDPHPEITALCIPGLVRSVFLFGPKGMNEKKVTSYLIRLLEHGVARRPERAAARRVERGAARKVG
jgi:AcrR family transcriptional regulator